MVCAPVRSIIPSLKLGDYLSVQAHKPCSISHFNRTRHPFKKNVEEDAFPNVSLNTIGSSSPISYFTHKRLPSLLLHLL